MATAFITSFRDEQALDNPPGPKARDWVLVAIVVIGSVIEGFLRTDLSWPIASMISSWIMAATLPWRRLYPLRAMIISFSAVIILMLASIATLGDAPPPGNYVYALSLLHVYALFRWASGHDATVGLGLMFIMFVIANLDDWTGIGEAIGGLIFFLFPAELGGVIRYRESAKVREIDQIRSREREQLARELHDTVAHHVSAIAIQAQAGRAMAATKPDAALELLAVIEEEASRTLSEMRSMVGSLRDQTDPDDRASASLTPQQGLADIESLSATGIGGTASVVVRRTGKTEWLSQPIETALFRIAQESITNAARHARSVQTIDITIDGTADDAVTMTVCNDGRTVTDQSDRAGYGLVGMEERAQLLGGTFDAGPNQDGGWTVTTTLPRTGVSS